MTMHATFAVFGIDRFVALAIGRKLPRLVCEAVPFRQLFVLVLGQRRRGSVRAGWLAGQAIPGRRPRAMKSE